MQSVSHPSPSQVSFDWVLPYLGKLGEHGAYGPETFDCWGLVWYIKTHEEGVADFPMFPAVNGRDKMKVLIEFERQIVEGPFQRIPDPRNLCIVALSKHLKMHHAGLYLEVDGGLVLHVPNYNCVVAEPVRNLRAKGYHTIHYYEYNGENNNSH